MSDETALYAKLEEVIGLSDKQYGTACRLINDRDTGFIRLLAKRASQPAIEGYLEGTSATGPSDSAALVRQDKLREHDVQDIREQVQELQQQAMLLRMHNYSVTPANRVGQLLLRNARRCVVEHLLPIMHLSVPDGVSSLLGKWGSYSKEEQIQAVVFDVAKHICRSTNAQHILLDTSKKDYYKNPTAKIDIALSTSEKVLWSTLVACIELKTQLSATTKYEEGVGQLQDRWEKVRSAQPARQAMLGLVMGQDAIDLFSFHQSGSVSHTGLLELQWSADNIGWQVLVSFLAGLPLQLGYISPTIPTPFVTALSLTVANIMPLANVFSSRRVFQVDYNNSTAVIKMASYDDIEHEVNIMRNLQGKRGCPQLLDSGALPPQCSTAADGATHYFIIRPVGQHLSMDSSVQQVLCAFGDVLHVMEALEQQGIVHSDISPSNIITVDDGNGSGARPRGVLLDFHVARKLEGKSSDTRATGKVMYRALSLHPEGAHTVASDLESLLLSLLDIASNSRALLWRHKNNEEDLYNSKLATMVSPRGWSRALSHCAPDLHGLLCAWHNIIFLPCSSEWYVYRPGAATIGGFRKAMQDLASQRTGT